MLNRRYLRVKVLQSVYAYLVSGENNVQVGVKHLLTSIEKLHDLFIWQLSFLVDMRHFTEKRIYDNQHKHLPTEEDLNPSLKFYNNRLLVAIEENVDFKREVERLKIHWYDEQEIFFDFYEKMIATEEYQAYINNAKDTFDVDKKFVMSLIDNMFDDCVVLQDFYEDKSIFFVEDYHLVTALILKWLSGLSVKNFDSHTKMPSIYKDEYDDEQFVRKLFCDVVAHDEEYAQLIADNTDKWEKERICIMDMLILKMALTELILFSEIPVKVTINEYIELSKYFSTPKSKAFVNGLVDRLAKRLQNDGTIVKTGLGLIDK